MVNTNYLGLVLVPIGVILCFGPALLIWLKAELSEKEPEASKDQASEAKNH